MTKEKIIERMAEQAGYRVLFHDGLCTLVPKEKGLLPWYDAPMDGVIEYLAHPIGEEAERDLMGKMLALDRFGIIGSIPGKSGVAILMQSKEGGPLPWCVQYLGGGRYFHDFNSLAVYIVSRYGGEPLDEQMYIELMTAYDRHKREGVPLRELLENGK